ncbi:MAG: hypothetical protein RIC55_14080 [Pirellulaceae bacterium]
MELTPGHSRGNRNRRHKLINRVPNLENEAMKSPRNLMFAAVPFLAVLAFVSVADAAWQYRGRVAGVDTYRDTITGKTWTVTIGKVPSSDAGRRRAAGYLNNLGFRFPTFGELQDMYNRNGGGTALGINTGLFDYYETADPRILGNAHGNGFQTPLRKQGIGSNYVIGVKR